MMMARVPPVPTSIPSTWIRPPRTLQKQISGDIIYSQAKMTREGEHKRARVKNLRQAPETGKGLAHLVSHQEEGTHLEASILRTQSLGVVLFLDVDEFLGGGDGFQRNVVVVAVLEHHQTTADIFEQKVQREIAIGHRGDGVDGIRITTAHEIAELLVDDVDSLAVIEFGGDLADFFSNDVADATKFLVAKSVGFRAFKDHLAAFEHRAFRNQNDRVLAGILAAVGNEQFGEPFDVELEFGNDAAIRGASHGRQHCSEAGVATEDFQHHETLVGAGGSAQAIDHLNRARDASAEADAIVCARDVVVHGFRNADDFEAFFVETDPVTERVVAADGNERVNAKPCKVFQDFGSQVVFFRRELAAEMVRHARLTDASRVGSRGMKEGTASAARTVYRFFVEEKEVVGIVLILLADHIHQAGPAVTNADNLIAFAQGAESDGADRRIEAGNVAAPGEDADDTPFGLRVCHVQIDRPFVGCRTKNYPLCGEI